jgi:formylmethanofuran dehydrogenase subunit E
LNEALKEFQNARCERCGKPMDFLFYVFSLTDGKMICKKCVERRHKEVTGE